MKHLHPGKIFLIWICVLFPFAVLILDSYKRPGGIVGIGWQAGPSDGLMLLLTAVVLILVSFTWRWLSGRE